MHLITEMKGRKAFFLKNNFLYCPIFCFLIFALSCKLVVKCSKKNNVKSKKNILNLKHFYNIWSISCQKTLKMFISVAESGVTSSNGLFCSSKTQTYSDYSL